jgi:deazaflavin-dependent oxidoreductase (nitroreductase family)
MSVQRRLARLNQVVSNRLVGRFFALLPGFGAVYHRGRRSGREYRTPVKVFRDGDKYVIALPYGTDSDWVRNVMAAGGCELRVRGRRVPLTEPRVFEDRHQAVVPRPLRVPLRWFSAYSFIELRTVDASDIPDRQTAP